MRAWSMARKMTSSSGIHQRRFQIQQRGEMIGPKHPLESERPTKRETIWRLVSPGRGWRSNSQQLLSFTWRCIAEQSLQWQTMSWTVDYEISVRVMVSPGEQDSWGKWKEEWEDNEEALLQQRSGGNSFLNPLLDRTTGGKHSLMQVIV